MRRCFHLMASALVLFAPAVAGAAVVVDFSPDTTEQAVGEAQFSNGVDSGVGSTGFGQYLGDRFTLAADTNITGGSIFSGTVQALAGQAVRFMIFADVAGLPGAALFDIGTTLDSVDSVLTSTQSELTRKHATIAPVFLAAGSYWFSMPGDGGVSIGQATTTQPGYDDGNFRFSSVYPPPALTNSPNRASGDMFFTLEGNVASAAVPEPVSLAIWSLGALGCVLSIRGRRRFALLMNTAAG